MSSIAYISDAKMLEFHRLQNNRKMNFWRLNNKGFTDFCQGEFIFFLSKDRRMMRNREKGIIGYGTLEGIDSLSVRKMWNKYGSYNGYGSYEEFSETLNKLSDKGETPKKISSLVVGDVVFFQGPIYLSEFDYNISRNIESYIYLEDKVTVSILKKASEIGLDVWTHPEKENKVDLDIIRVELFEALDAVRALEYKKSELKAIRSLIPDRCEILKDHQDLGFEIDENRVTIHAFLINDKYQNELTGYLVLLKKQILGILDKEIVIEFITGNDLMDEILND
ncbi:MAG: hypothetical protein IIZ11_00720 [Erysipelotrichaceae bacterium]|nr:hypothetical protein [Erysipelotrichaceae bacterium]